MNRARYISYHIIGALLVVGAVLTAAFLFRASYVDLWNNCTSLGRSVAYFFCTVFGIDPPLPPSAGTLPPDVVVDVLPSTPEGFGERWARFCALFVSYNHFIGFLSNIASGIANASLMLNLFILIVVDILLLVAIYPKPVNNDYFTVSRPLKLYKAFSRKVLQPILEYFRGLAECLRRYRAYWITALITWVMSLNLATVAVGFLSFYFYFAASFDFVAIYTNLVKLFAHLKTFFTFMPWWVYVIGALNLINVWRKRIALEFLRHMEMRNRGVINSLPVTSLLVGTMGSGKTTMLTDMTLSAQAMFRDKAFELMTEQAVKFPAFPWQRFENVLKRAIKTKGVFNLSSCRRFVESKRKKFEKRPRIQYIFGYDYVRKPMTFDDKLKLVDLWDILESYAQLYYIYREPSSIIAGNYSVRDDALVVDNGNFPLRNNNFFNRNSRYIDAYSRYSHIIDFDALRLGKKVVENNPHAGSFEFGVINITEGGKERGNQKENTGLKKTDANANQLNDGFNRWVKMCRHAATVENYPFIKVFFDEQRPDSLGADARELCKIVHIREISEKKIALPLFGFEEWLHNFLFKRLLDKYLNHRYRRGDVTLTSYILHHLAAAIHNRYTRLYNLYGYKVQTIDIEDGTQDGQYTRCMYYLAFKKIYSKRFDTACFADIFGTAALKTSGGVNAYHEYGSERATVSELKEQNSYFIADLTSVDNNKDYK